jgi:hypothetical protein
MGTHSLATWFSTFDSSEFSLLRVCKILFIVKMLNANELHEIIITCYTYAYNKFIMGSQFPFLNLPSRTGTLYHVP